MFQIWSANNLTHITHSLSRKHFLSVSNFLISFLLNKTLLVPICIADQIFEIFPLTWCWSFRGDKVDQCLLIERLRQPMWASIDLVTLFRPWKSILILSFCQTHRIVLLLRGSSWCTWALLVMNWRWWHVMKIVHSHFAAIFIDLHRLTTSFRSLVKVYHFFICFLRVCLFASLLHCVQSVSHTKTSMIVSLDLRRISKVATFLWNWCHGLHWVSFVVGLVLVAWFARHRCRCRSKLWLWTYWKC